MRLTFGPVSEPEVRTATAFPHEGVIFMFLKTPVLNRSYLSRPAGMLSVSCVKLVVLLTAHLMTLLICFSFNNSFDTSSVVEGVYAFPHVMGLRNFLRFTLSTYTLIRPRLFAWFSNSSRGKSISSSAILKLSGSSSCQMLRLTGAQRAKSEADVRPMTSPQMWHRLDHHWATCSLKICGGYLRLEPSE